MASTEISAITTLISGKARVAGAVTASGNTCTITGPSGGPLDFSTLAIRVANEATGSGALITLEVGSTYSQIGVGDYDITLATAGTVYIGGKLFESARFKQTSAQSLLMTFTTTTGSGSTCACSIEAVQAPYGVTG